MIIKTFDPHLFSGSCLHLQLNYHVTGDSAKVIALARLLALKRMCLYLVGSSIADSAVEHV